MPEGRRVFPTMTVRENLEMGGYIRKDRRQVADERAQATVGHYRKGRSGGWQSELGPRQRRVFHSVAGDLLCELGYAEEGWWATSMRQKLVLPVLATIDISGREAGRP